MTEPVPIAMWRLPKAEAMARLPAAMGVRDEADAFLRAARDGYSCDQNPEQFIAIITQGVAFRAAVAEWRTVRGSAL